MNKRGWDITTPI